MKSMTICSARSILCLHRIPTFSNSTDSPFIIPVKSTWLHFKPPPPAISTVQRKIASPQDYQVNHTQLQFEVSPAFQSGTPRLVIVGAVALGVAFYLLGGDGQRAMALGPEGPLMEEFWENVRRYALYALTVSTGAIYTIFQPILELLKNPISAILVLALLGSGVYVVSQVVYAMVGVSNFTYDYGY